MVDKMHKSTKVFAVAGLAVASMLACSATFGYCYVAGKVGAVWSYNANYAYFGIAPESDYGAGYLIYFYAPNTYSAYDTLMNAAASDEYVYVYGDASSCPSISSGIGSGGTLMYAFTSDYR